MSPIGLTSRYCCRRIGGHRHWGIQQQLHSNGGNIERMRLWIVSVGCICMGVTEGCRQSRQRILVDCRRWIRTASHISHNVSVQCPMSAWFLQCRIRYTLLVQLQARKLCNYCPGYNLTPKLFYFLPVRGWKKIKDFGVEL